MLDVSLRLFAVCTLNLTMIFNVNVEKKGCIRCRSGCVKLKITDPGGPGSERLESYCMKPNPHKGFFMRLLKHIFFLVRLKWTSIVWLLEYSWILRLPFFQSEPVQVRAPAPEQFGQRVPVFCQFRLRLLLVIQIFEFFFIVRKICLIEIFFLSSDKMTGLVQESPVSGLVLPVLLR